MTDPVDMRSHPPRQRSARTDPAMRDGDSGHGNPYELAGDEVALDSDNDISDTTDPEDGFDPQAVQRDTLAVDPDRLDTLVDSHPGPEQEAEYEEEEFAAESEDANLPIDDYESMTIPQVIERAEKLNPSDVTAVAEYERQHRNRRTLLTKLERLMSRSG